MARLVALDIGGVGPTRKASFLGRASEFLIEASAPTTAQQMLGQAALHFVREATAGSGEKAGEFPVHLPLT